MRVKRFGALLASQIGLSPSFASAQCRHFTSTRFKTALADGKESDTSWLGFPTSFGRFLIG
jgi:hypothetical protein